MYQAIYHFLNMPVPMWFLALCVGLLWLEQRRARRWIDQEDMKRLREMMTKPRSD